MPALINLDQKLDTVFMRMADGESLSAVCKTPGLPCRVTVLNLVRNNPVVREAYEAAQLQRADFLADQMMELANQEMPEHLDPSERASWVNHLRVKIDVAKWTASKLRPLKWGDRLQIDVDASISISAALTAANNRVIDLHQNSDIEDLPDVSVQDVSLPSWLQGTDPALLPEWLNWS